jgi:DNA modification methylase
MYELFLGDCIDILRAMPDKSVDCIVTDPPYVIGAQGGGLARKRKYLAKISDGALDSGFDSLLLEEFLRILKAPSIILFCSRLQIRDYLNWAHQHDLKWSLICWHKPNPTPLTNNNYLPDTEYILHFWRGNPLRGGYHSKHRFYVLPTCKNVVSHPTAKPLSIVKNLILNATSRGDIIRLPSLAQATNVLLRDLSRHSATRPAWTRPVATREQLRLGQYGATTLRLHQTSSHVS